MPDQVTDTTEAPAEPAAAVSPAAEPVAAEPLLKTSPDDKPVAAPTDWPADWRERMAGDDAKAVKALQRYQTPQAMAKAMLEARAKIGAGDYIRAKPKGDDPEAIKAWRSEVGLPDSPEGYREALPKDGWADEAKPLLDNFIAEMHAADAPPALVAKAAEWYLKTQNVMAEQHAKAVAEADATFRTQSEDALRAEWGADFTPTFNGIRAVLTTYGTPEAAAKLFGARLEDGRPLGDDPDVLRFLASVSRDLNPRGTVVPSPGQNITETIKTEMAALETEMKDARSPAPGSYWVNPAKQARYRELVEQSERLKR